ncbi:MAG: FecR family protein [Carboxylicivirga sp.]|jgi:ferric-dicitrate binding protein FerR (iron transport regulator)|nr:FecR family protein [Carboxylicivirga sp.]
MSNKEQLENLILNYLEGKISVSDSEWLMNWRSQSSENNNEFVRIEKVLKEQYDYINEQKTDAARERVKDKVLFSLRSKNRRFKNWLAYSTAIYLIAITANVFVLKDQGNTLDGELFVYSPKGKTAQIYLPDGTKVWLNGDSKILYQNNFGNDTRSVTLSGEAYFEVAKNEDTPFIVATVIANVKVYGTKFNVKEDRHNDMMAVTLEEGSVSVLTTEDEEIKRLQPGDLIKVNSNGEVAEYNQVQTKYFTSWKEGVYHFRQEELSTIAKKLEEIYNVKIEFREESIKSKRFRCVVNSDNSIVHTLERLRISSHINYEIKGSHIYFK